ncbi:MAG: gamma-glutamyltransferase, partial [Clostridia bacterium]|nr:gamma-glutamyltransferase [Clostridia bacterium]
MQTSFDPLMQLYPSQRYPIYAANGMVNCSSPLAAAAGLEMLRRGGNAMDAAVAAAAALTVVEPTANGLGSDAFAILWSEKEQKLRGLNSSGPAPRLASIERILEDGKDDAGKMPRHGWTPVTVPGAVKAWAEISSRYGRLPFASLLAPAIAYARDGYPCAPNLSESWKASYRGYRKQLTGEAFRGWFDTFASGDHAPEAGEIVRLPDHARTLEVIGESGGKTFYTGDLARRIDEESRKRGGYLRYEDLAAYEALWVDPLRLDYRGYEVCEIPPNGQGITALIALNILKNFDFPEKNAPETFHRQIEAMKMAFADSLHYVTDPGAMERRPEDFLTPEYGQMRAAQMEARSRIWTHGTPPSGGTVYLCCADGEGNMVSYIQSNYMGFGSGIVVPGT